MKDIEIPQFKLKDIDGNEYFITEFNDYEHSPSFSIRGNDPEIAFYSIKDELFSPHFIQAPKPVPIFVTRQPTRETIELVRKWCEENKIDII